MRKGVRCDVLRNVNYAALGFDPTNGGITTKVTEILLVGVGVPELDDASDGVPMMELRSIEVAGSLHYCASTIRENAPWARGQSGGNFIVARGGRSDRDRLPYEPTTIGDYPIPAHDRED